MKPILFLLLGILSCITACKQGPADKGKNTPKTDTGKFYALGVYFKEQIQYVDLRNFPIYQINTLNGKRDSVALSKEQFIAETRIFTEKDISTPSLSGGYRETVFNDLSTGSITLNYTPVNGEAPIQNIDILLSQETNQVKRVFIKSIYTRGDTTITEICSWKTDKSCQINRSYITQTGSKGTELHFINWNDKP